jgi:hypothetical protein
MRGLPACRQSAKVGWGWGWLGWGLTSICKCHISLLQGERLTISHRNGKKACFEPQNLCKDIRISRARHSFLPTFRWQRRRPFQVEKLTRGMRGWATQPALRWEAEQPENVELKYTLPEVCAHITTGRR